MSVAVDIRRALGAALLTSMFLVTSAAAQWASDGNPLCTATGIQASPVVVSDGAGGAIVAWPDLRNGNWDLFAQRVNAYGVPQWTADGVAVCAARGDQGSVRIVSDGAHGAILVWHDYQCGSHIYAQRLDARGHRMWAENGISLCSDPGYQIDPQCASGGSGGVIAAWSDSRGSLYASRVSGEGALLWGSAGVPLTQGVGDELAIDSDGAGGAVATFSVAANVYVQRIDSTGARRWGTSGASVRTGSLNYPLQPVVVADGLGGAVLAWTDGRAGNAPHIWAQRVDGTGVPQWTTDGLPLCTAPNGQDSPMMTTDGAHGAIVAWLDARWGNICVYGRRVTASGDTLWGTYGVSISGLSGAHTGLAIASDGEGGALVTGQIQDSGSGWDIFIQRVTGSGTMRWGTNGVTLCNARNDQTGPAICSDDAGGALVAWADARASAAGSDIYAQRVDSTGQAPVVLDAPRSPSMGAQSLAAVPNPFRASTTLTFELTAPSDVSLEIFDLRGASVRRLATGRFEAGVRSVAWDGRNSSEARVASGFYFVRLVIGHKVIVRRIAVTR